MVVIMSDFEVALLELCSIYWLWEEH